MGVGDSLRTPESWKVRNRRLLGNLFILTHSRCGAESFRCSPPLVQAAVGTAALSLLQRNSLPSTHIRCRTTAKRLATATMARRIPRR